MTIFIRATANISPQETFGRVPFLANPVEYTGTCLKVIEPDYKNFIDPKMIRRMSRIIRMGVAAASECLKEAGLEEPGAIITGTAYGCLEDTDIFLRKIIEQNEEMLSPTSFIQSTHNTVGAQIALMTKCHHYNNTFVHKGFSFESALLDAILLLRENEATNVLIGSVEEVSDLSYAVLNRFGMFKTAPVSNLKLYSSNTKGTIAGEGAAFFLLASQPAENDLALLDAMVTFYQPKDIAEIKDHITGFLSSRSVSIDDIDLVITGKNGDIKNDCGYDHLIRSLFRNKEVINFKHLCGEYPTATSFALWLAANIIRTGSAPAATGYKGSATDKLKYVLIYNNYQHVYHSLFLVSAC